MPSGDHLALVAAFLRDAELVLLYRACPDARGELRGRLSAHQRALCAEERKYHRRWQRCAARSPESLVMSALLAVIEEQKYWLAVAITQCSPGTAPGSAR